MKQLILLLSVLFLFAQCNDGDNETENTNELKHTLMKNDKSDRGIIKENVITFFNAVDNQDWETVESIFCDSVISDYKSMSGGEPEKLGSEEIIDSWKAFLPGFDKTHHQLGNFLVDLNSDTAVLSCYVTATHYLENISDENVWTVVGSYDLELKDIKGFWKISKMTFKLKYTDGNQNLAKLAHSNIK